MIETGFTPMYIHAFATNNRGMRNISRFEIVAFSSVDRLEAVISGTNKTVDRLNAISTIANPMGHPAGFVR
jgi:hypothetical protein